MFENKPSDNSQNKLGFVLPFGGGEEEPIQEPRASTQVSENN